MANETTDTTTSQTQNEAPAAIEPAVSDASTQATAETETDASADEGTVLGGKPVASEAETETEATTEAEVETPAGAPEKYEFAMEGVELDADLLTEAEPILRELNLSNDDANKLLPAANQLVEKTRDNTIQQITDYAAQQRADWLKIAKSDPEIGGAKWDDTVQSAAKGLDALGFKEGHPFREMLNDTGFGNNRDMISAFRQIGQLAGEDGGFVRPDAASQTVSAKDILYGSKE